jgi:hypothetical protein
MTKPWSDVSCPMWAVASLAAAASLAGAPAQAAPAASTSGEARVNGKSLVVAYAYLFHAPDQWNEKQTNDVALLTTKPIDAAALKNASTLTEALKYAPERIVVEAHPDGKADLSICHIALEGLCYSTPISLPQEWEHASAPNGHLTGHVRIFGGEQTVFQKYKLFYDFTFDAAPVRDFTKRR